MLVLSRRRYEAVIVGSDIRVTVLDVCSGDEAVRGGQVKLGFQAPDDVAIQRQELLRRVKSSSSSSSPRRPRPDVTGKKQMIDDAVVRLQLETPPGTSIHCSRASGNSSDYQQLVSVHEVESGSANSDNSSNDPMIRIVDCRKDDHLLIGKQLMITITGVFRFVADSPPVAEQTE